MKLVWCPEMASKAYIDGVKAVADHDLTGSADIAELVSAMAGGWNAQLIVEAPAGGPACPTATSQALAAAARHTGGRYACVLPDAAAYAAGMGAPGGSVVVGEAGVVMGELEGVDLLVVDGQRRDSAAVLAAARPGARGMVVVRHGGGRRRGAAALAASMAAGTRIVRAVYLPIGKGVEVVHVGVGKGPSLSSRRGCYRASRWVRHVDHDTGEEHVFRRR